MLSTTEIIIRIAIMIAGIFLHQLFPSNIPLLIIGAILIFIAPISMYKKYEQRIYEDPANTTVGEWRDIPEAKLRELLDIIPHVSSVSSGGASRWTNIGGLVIYIFVIIWVAVQIGALLVAEEVVSAVTLVDIVMCLINIYRFYGGSLKAHPVSLQADALSLFLDFQLPRGFTKKFQAHIVKDVNGDPDILNVRMQIHPNDPISGLLCMMTTISRTNVKGNNYPFAYFVIVFGGCAFNRQSTQFISDLRNVVISGNTTYTLEDNINDGNSVLVILPRKPKYSTGVSECTMLCNIMAECCRLCDTYRKEIEAIAIPPTKK